MELFHNAKTVKLRSRHKKYLLADDNQVTVVQERHGGSVRARWTVECVQSAEGVGLVRLKSCYGKYLTATDEPFFMGVTGKKVHQTTPKKLDSSVEWEPIGDEMQVKLKTRYGNFLRANGGVPPWRNSVTHDVPSRTHTQGWILWNVEVLEVLEVNEKRKPSPEKQKGDGNVEEKEKSYGSDSKSFSIKSPRFSRMESSDSVPGTPSKNEGRVIDYNIVDDEGKVVNDGTEVQSIHFKGHTLEELKQSLEEETGLADVAVCARNPLNGKLYLLRLSLPPNHVKMHVFLVPLTSEVTEELGTPSSP